MPEALRLINLESGKPTAEEALKRLSEAIDAARRDGVKALKIIHGYGSSGTGGVLCDRVQKSLVNRRNQGKIRACVFGEKWNSFEQVARDLLEACPELSRDRDYNRNNPGVSLVLL
jgi:hypothetical protein